MSEKKKIDIKNQLKDLKKTKLRNKPNFWGLVLAAICLFLAVLVPLTITNNEVKAAKEAAAAEAQRAFEEAKQAAIEAEKKAEEERLLAMNQALAEERAAAKKAEEERLAAEKAAKEREELLEEINKRTQDTVTSIVNKQTEEDFNTQYAIQDTLIESQTGTISLYEEALNKQTDILLDRMEVLDEIKDETEAIKGKTEVIKDTTEDVQSYVNDLRKEEEAIKEAHYSKKNRVDALFSGAGSVTDFDSNTVQSGKVALSATYLRKVSNIVSLGGALAFDNPKGLSLRAVASFLPVDKVNFDVHLSFGAGVRYSMAESRLTGLFTGSAGLRYAFVEGFELVFEPTIALSSDFKEVNRVCFMPLTLGLSITF